MSEPQAAPGGGNGGGKSQQLNRLLGENTVAFHQQFTPPSLTKRVGVIGPLATPKFRQLEGYYKKLAPLGNEYVRLRMITSEEVLDWLRINNLTVGSASIDLLLTRHTYDVSVTVLRREGNVAIVTEQ